MFCVKGQLETGVGSAAMGCTVIVAGGRARLHAQRLVVVRAALYCFCRHKSCAVGGSW